MSLSRPISLAAVATLQPPETFKC